jgi:hypothetical protein
VTYISIGIIWIVRLYFFFEYEESERHEKEKAATLRNLALSYTGNLTWYLTPIHISFLVCYCIFLVDLVIFGILSEHVKNTLKHVMRKCLRDMREISKTSRSIPFWLECPFGTPCEYNSIAVLIWNNTVQLNNSVRMEEDML